MREAILLLQIRRAGTAVVLAAFAICMLTAAFPALAQQTNVFRVGWLSADRAGGGSPFFDAFREGLRDLGYVEGRNLTIDARWGEGSSERLDRLASSLKAAA